MEKLNSRLLTAEIMAREALAIHADALRGYRFEKAVLSLIFSPEIRDYFPGCTAVFVRKNTRENRKITVVSSPLLNKVLTVSDETTILPITEAGRVYRYGYLCAEVVNLENGLGLKISCQDMTSAPCLSSQEAKKRLDAFIVMWPYENLRSRYHHTERHSVKPYFAAGELRWCLILDSADHRFDGIFVNVENGGISPFSIPEEYLRRIRNVGRYSNRNRPNASSGVYFFNGNAFEVVENGNYLLSKKEAETIWRKVGGLFKLKASDLQEKECETVICNGERAYLLAADGKKYCPKKAILISAETGSIFSEDDYAWEKLIFVDKSYRNDLGHMVVSVDETGFVARCKT